jgi:spore germination cell wall hydrolase CwlJ-like protein
MHKRLIALSALGLATFLAGCGLTPQPEEPAVVAYAEPPPEPTIAQSRAQAELECLAKAVYFEARGENEIGQRAVAAVVLNRVRSLDFPNSICAVVQQGGTARRDCQFSWWCDGLSDEPRDTRAWVRAATIAHEMIQGAPDPTNGALYFHSTRVAPSWRSQLRRVSTIGAHIYYQ